MENQIINAAEGGYSELSARLSAWREALAADTVFILDASTGIIELSQSADRHEVDYVHDLLVESAKMAIQRGRPVFRVLETWEVARWTMTAPVMVAGDLVKVLGFAGFDAREERSGSSLMLIETFADWLGDHLLRRTSFDRLLANVNNSKTLLNITSEALVALDPDGRINFINASAERILDTYTEEVYGLKANEALMVVTESGERLGFDDLSSLAIVTGMPLAFKGRVELSDGPGSHVEGQVFPLSLGGAADIASAILFRDMDATNELQQKLVWQYSHDQLTGLKNRSELEARIAEVLREAEGRVARASFIHLGVDGMEMVNNQCSNAGGDELIRRVGNVLKGLPGVHPDAIARIGGDEFGLLLEGMDLRQASRIFDTILTSLNGVFEWGGRDIHCTVSAGIVPLRTSIEHPEDVLMNSAMALRMAKSIGRGERRILRSTKESDHSYGDLHVIGMITKALSDKRLVLLSQRIAPLEGAKAPHDHHEIFVRLRSESGALITPDKFIPVAERNNLMPAMDKAIFEAALDAFPMFPEHDVLSINMSGKTIAYPGIFEFIKSAIEARGVNPKRICFEITETAAIASEEEAADLLGNLKSIGCMVSMDDYGCGYHTPNLMKALSPEYVKIDGGFIRRMFKPDGFDRAVVESIINMAKRIDAEVIAESVENEETLQALKEMGVAFAQGWHIHRPEEIRAAKSVH